MLETKVINFYAGPSAGKTTAALEFVSLLKKRGYEVEFAPEFAKELLYGGFLHLLDGSLVNEVNMINEKHRRLKLYDGKVEFIVTDAPLNMSIFYASDEYREWLTWYVKEIDTFNNYNVFIERGEDYDTKGRKQTYEESLTIDKEIKSFLVNYKSIDRDEVSKLLTLLNL